MFQIEKNVPLPGDATPNAKYPWREMKAGDSFFVGASGEDALPTQNRLSSASSLRGTTYGETYMVRAVIGGFRVWRVK